MPSNRIALNPSEPCNKEKTISFHSTVGLKGIHIMDIKNLHQQVVYYRKSTNQAMCFMAYGTHQASFRMASRCATACALAFTKSVFFSTFGHKTTGNLGACSLIPCSFSTCISSSSFASHFLDTNMEFGGGEEIHGNEKNKQTRFLNPEILTS